MLPLVVVNMLEPKSWVSHLVAIILLGVVGGCNHDASTKAKMRDREWLKEMQNI